MNAVLVIIFMITVGAMYPSCAHLEMSGSASGISSGNHRDDIATNNPPAPVPLMPNNWTNMNPSQKPSAIYGHAMAYDSQDNRVILFGGNSITSWKDETWAYDFKTNNWTNKNPSTKPSGRMWASMAYDPRRDRTILFGGWTSPSNGWNGETWAYDYKKNIWTNLTPTQIIHPSARRGHAMVYDSNANRIILFGGLDINNVQDDTWVYDSESNSWTQRFPTSNPDTTYYHVMAYNSKAKQTILFGGYDGSHYYNNTWTYDYTSNNWTKKSMTIRPSARVYSSLAYDSKYDRTILFGGYDISKKDDTWAYDYNYNTWVQMYPGTKPPARFGHAMAYDSSANRTVLFGGFDGSKTLGDTWVYELTDVGSGPHVVSTTPNDGDIYVPVNTNIVITFSTSMDVVATSGAISSVPAITGGSLTWDPTMKIVTWAPGSNLQLGTKYTITISTAARSMSAVNMKYPYVFSFTTIPPPDTFPPYVVSTFPNNGDINVPATTKVSITWNESMNKMSAQNAFSSAPSITGSWSWTSVTQKCTPTVALQFNTKYTITISTIAKDLAGNNMKSSYEFSFTTSLTPDIDPPYIVSTTPTDGATNVSIATKIDIEWNESMNLTSAESAFSSSPTIVCAWSWSGTNQTCTPSSALQSNTQYQITIATTAKDLAGNTMKNTYAFSFTTQLPQPPKIVGTNPVNGETAVALAQDIVVTFSNPMNKTSVSTTCIPDPLGWSQTWSNGDRSVTFKHNKFSYYTHYEFNVTAAKDKNNMVLVPGTIANPWSFTTTTPIEIARVELVPYPSVAMAVGDLQIFSAQAYDKNDTNLDTDVNYSWSLVGTPSGSISPLWGKNTGFMATAAGSCSVRITAKHPSGTEINSTVVSVNLTAPTMDRVEVTPPSAILDSGNSTMFRADAYNGSYLLGGVQFHWTISDTQLGSLNGPDNQIVTFNAVGGGSGKLTVNATYKGKSMTGTADITVNQPVFRIEIAPSNPEPLRWLEPISFSAAAYDSVGRKIATGITFTWSVSGGIGNLNKNTGESVVLTTAKSQASGKIMAIAEGKSNFTDVSVLNDLPPIIIHTKVLKADSNTDIPIRANITDDYKVEEAMLYYRLVGSSDWELLKMIRVGADDYTATIPSSAVISDIEYYIEATDDMNQTATSGSSVMPYKVTVSTENTSELPLWLFPVLLIIIILVALLILLAAWKRRRQNDEAMKPHRITAQQAKMPVPIDSQGEGLKNLEDFLRGTPSTQPQSVKLSIPPSPFFKESANALKEPPGKPAEKYEAPVKGEEQISPPEEKMDKTPKEEAKAEPMPEATPEPQTESKTTPVEEKPAPTKEKPQITRSKKPIKKKKKR